MTMFTDALTCHFNNMFKKWSDSQQIGRIGGIHASDILKSSELEKGKFDNRFCYRECVLKCFYKPNPVDNSEYIMRIFLHGWKIHEKWQALFEKYCKVEAIEKTVFDDRYCPIGFTPDAIISFMNKRIIVEIKGYKVEEFDKYDEEGEVPEVAETQAQLYCHLTNIDDCVILVECKNTQRFKLWHVKANVERIQFVIERMQKIAKQIEKWKGTEGVYLPKKICSSSTCERASKCSVSNACFEGLKYRQEHLMEEKDWLA